MTRLEPCSCGDPNPHEIARRCILAGCPVGGTVLDPFCGVGTSGLVAVANGRGFVGVELVPASAEQACARIGLFARLEVPCDSP